jgi:sugar lactone lactonase YvrE
MQHPIKFCWLILMIIAAMLIVPSNARADRLFTGDDWGTQIYEIDTTYGAWSKTVFCNNIDCVNGLATDGKGNLFESDFGSHSIYKITPDGKYTTFANLDSPGAGMAFDSEDNLFIPFQRGGRIDKLSPDGSTSSVFATGLPQPVQVVFDSLGELFVTDQRAGCVYKIDPDDGTRSTFANGLRSPIGLVYDRKGILFVADPVGNIIYKFTTNGDRTIFSRHVRSPCSLVFDSHGNLFVSNGTGSIFKFKNASGTLSSKPTLFASGLGHNYYMTIMPGSIPLRVLLANLFSRPWVLRGLALSALLIVGLVGGIWLWRKMRRT